MLLVIEHGKRGKKLVVSGIEVVYSIMPNIVLGSDCTKYLLMYQND